MCPIAVRNDADERSKETPHNLPPNKPYFSPKEVARIFDVPIRTWQGIEARGEGPRRIKIGRSVRYARSDLEAWIKQQSQRSPQDR